jgi:hypothetical protein
MGFTTLDKALWILGLCGQLTLLFTLVIRGRVRVFPVFTALIAFESAQTVLNFAAYRTGNDTLYFWTYWLLASVDSLLQLALIYEMARKVLQPTGNWVRDARALFSLLGFLGAFLAAGLSYAVKPHGTTSIYSWSIRLDLFTSLLIAELVVAMSLSAQRLGLQWRSWVIGLGQGLMIWVSVSLFVDTAQSYWGWAKSGRYIALDHFRIGAFIIALGYWSVVFWRNEPERKPISPEMMKYLYSLQADLAYDLGRVHPKRK